MTTIGAFEAKGHFSEPLDRVEKGERIAITRPGKRLDGLPLRALIAEGRIE
jgi:antitoxin (DNA-binding transcriptional repressor) of toxin-antitoxin stability system